MARHIKKEKYLSCDCRKVDMNPSIKASRGEKCRCITITGEVVSIDGMFMIQKKRKK